MEETASGVLYVYRQAIPKVDNSVRKSFFLICDLERTATVGQDSCESVVMFSYSFEPNIWLIDRVLLGNWLNKYDWLISRVWIVDWLIKYWSLTDWLHINHWLIDKMMMIEWLNDDDWMIAGFPRG